MKVAIKKLPDIEITLTNEEAVWLMGFIQNFPGDPEMEDQQAYTNRKDLFDELHCRLT